jgi:hypothetical protein
MRKVTVQKKREKTCWRIFIIGLVLQLSYNNLLKVTSGFSSNNLIGVGNFGSIYKAILDDKEMIGAVKVLNL